MGKFMQALMLDTVLITPVLPPYAVEDYKGLFPTKTLYITC